MIRMKSNLSFFIWIAILVVIISFILDLEDDINNMQPEIQRLEQLKNREKNSLSNIDWNTSLIQARAAKLEWLNKISPVDNPGYFKAEAMESISKICENHKIQCRLSAQGEASPLSSESPVVTSEKVALFSKDFLFAITKVTLPINSPQLEDFLHEIENGIFLRKIDKFSFRSEFIDINVKSYGMKASTLNNEKRVLLQKIEIKSND